MLCPRRKSELTKKSLGKAIILLSKTIRMLESFGKMKKLFRLWCFALSRSLGQFSQLIFQFHKHNRKKNISFFAFGSLIEFLHRNKINFCSALWLYLWDGKQYADPANLISFSLSLPIILFTTFVWISFSTGKKNYAENLFTEKKKMKIKFNPKTANKLREIFFQAFPLVHQNAF